MAILVFFIKKKNGSLYLVQKYQNLNAITIKYKYLLLLISKFITKLQSIQYFTKLDMCQSFNNVHIKPSNKQKAVFYTNHSLFKPPVVKIVNSGLYFIFSFHFILLFFSFLFRTAQVRGYQSRCHISHKLMAQSQD